MTFADWTLPLESLGESTLNRTWVTKGGRSGRKELWGGKGKKTAGPGGYKEGNKVEVGREEK